MENNQVLDIIIALVKAVKDGKEKGGKKMDMAVTSGEHTLFNCKYLLGQVLRNYQIPPKNYYISVKAKKMWEELTSADINDYFYDERFICDCVKDSVSVKKFTGAKNEGEYSPVRENEKIKFNDVFHAEHIIPIKVIIEELCNLEEPNDKNVPEILSKICICRILKDEDREINKQKGKSSRPFDKDKVIRGIYKQAGITVEGYPY